MFYLLFATPLFGYLKNYVKYKNFNFYIFIRTPLIYILLNYIFRINNIWKLLIYERWYFLIYKTFLSLIRNDYINKKNKYIKKYNLIYK